MQTRITNVVVVLLLVGSVALVGAVRQPERALAQTGTFTQSQPISIPTSTGPSKADPYPLPITVPANPDGFVTGATVRINGLSHTAAFDLDIMLVGPTGRSVLLMSDAGRTTDLNNATLTFSDSASNPLPETTAIASGTYRPTNYGSGDTFPSPAPGPPKGGYGTSLATFNNVNRVGTWRLYILDDFPTSFAGSLANGWTLSLRVNYIEATVTETFSTTASALIQNVSAASPYPSRVTVSGLAGAIEHLRVTLNISHTSPDDLDILLVGPAGGGGVVLMSDVGGSADITNLALTFDDDAPGTAPDSGPLSSGSVRPTDVDSGVDDAIVHPAPGGPRASALSEYDATGPNGVWSLYVLDDNPTREAGTIHSWSIEVETNEAPVPNPVEDIIADAGTQRDVILRASDADGDHIDWAGVNFESYVTFASFSLDGTIARLRLTPTADDIGDDYTAFVTVSDGFASVDISFRITVIEDATAPIVEFHPDPIPNDNGWVNQGMFIEILGVDEPGGSGIARMIVHLDNGDTVQSIGPRRTFASNVNGETTINYQALDNGGNFSPITPFIVRIDQVAPTVNSVTTRFPVQGRIAQLMSGDYLVPVQARWSGSDEHSGIDEYQLHLETDDVDGFVFPLPDPLATQLTVQLRPGFDYRFIANAIDRADNRSLDRFSPSRRVLLRDDTFGGITYSDGWADSANVNFIDGNARASSTADETTTFTFTGRNVAWITAFAPTGGIAEVTLDGGTPVRIDTFATTLRTRQIAFSANNLTNTSHTLTIRVTGDRNTSATGQRILIDGFAVLR